MIAATSASKFELKSIRFSASTTSKPSLESSNAGFSEVKSVVSLIDNVAEFDMLVSWTSYVIDEMYSLPLVKNIGLDISVKSKKETSFWLFSELL